MLSFHRSRSRCCRLNLTITSSSPSSFTTDAKNKNNYDDDDSCTSTSTSSGHITDLLDVSDHYSRHSCMKSEEEIEIVTVTQKKNKKEKKSTVQFSTVHIRDYSLCLGDNPSVSQGPPISLDWYYDNETWYDIDDHEKQKQGRGGAPCCVPPKERLNLLKQIGYSQKELTEAIRRVEKSKKQHFRTRKWLQKTDLIRSFF
mmetsp:Transcript_9666/g.11160  ORF Transcript_9666/g.11160 Transcript_9666/m.11160 type:complete len:200 (-) Transcript_9666:123-722(-)